VPVPHRPGRHHPQRHRHPRRRASHRPPPRHGTPGLTPPAAVNRRPQARVKITEAPGSGHPAQSPTRANTGNGDRLAARAAAWSIRTSHGLALALTCISPVGPPEAERDRPENKLLSRGSPRTVNPQFRGIKGCRAAGKLAVTIPRTRPPLPSTHPCVQNGPRLTALPSMPPTGGTPSTTAMPDRKTERETATARPRHASGPAWVTSGRRVRQWTIRTGPMAWWQRRPPESRALAPGA
jgi:hypothetical protein